MSKIFSVLFTRTAAVLLAAALLVIGSPFFWSGTVSSMFNVFADDNALEVWWPTDGATLTGEQPFKGMLTNRAVNDYVMYWQVDDGGKNVMDSNYQDYPHKESPVDLSGWSWKGSGPYKITFSAYSHSGDKLAQKDISVNVGDKGASSETSNNSVEVISVNTAAAATAEAVAPGNEQVGIDVWWPTQDARLSGRQPFKALAQGKNVEDYKMYWRVGIGKESEMKSDYADYPHKEAVVDVSAWSGSGPHTITFTAKAGSKVIGVTTRTVYKTGEAAAPLAPAADPAAKTEPAVSPANGGGLSGAKLYVDYNTPAQSVNKIAGQPVAKWLGGWSNIGSDVGGAVSAASKQGAVPVFVAYNIPQRDCGGYSAGGVGSADAYKGWINDIANTIGGNKAAVILEPDALSQITCLSGGDQARRYELLNHAVNTLKSKGNIAVYLDAGHSGWISSSDMAARLKSAGIDRADGFALNVSNFKTTSEETAYGKDLSGKLGGRHFVIDTSRNGNGSNGEWCNPSGRALGAKPTTSTGDGVIDGYLWIKQPGESDGWCNGGPSAGTFWADYAWGLASRASW